MAVLVSSSCLTPVPDGPRGFKCSSAADCDQTTSCIDGVCTSTQDAGARPMRLAVYNMSFPFSFGDAPPHDVPSRGFYSSSGAGLIRQHFADLTYGHFSGGVVNWYGPGRSGDAEFAALLERSEGTGFRWSVMYERESLDRPDAAVASSVLTSARTRFSANAHYLSSPDGGFFFFVDDNNSAFDPCDVADRWVLANESTGHRAWLVLHAPAQGVDHLACARQPDAWFRMPTTSNLGLTDQFVTVVPGFFASGDTQPKVSRDPTRFAFALAVAADAGTRIELIDSFNVWAEGTAVESSPSWASDSGFGVYLDLLHAQ